MEMEFEFGFEYRGLTCTVKLASCSAYVGGVIDFMVGLEGYVVEHDVVSC